MGQYTGSWCHGSWPQAQGLSRNVAGCRGPRPVQVPRPQPVLIPASPSWRDRSGEVQDWTQGGLFPVCPQASATRLQHAWHPRRGTVKPHNGPHNLDFTFLRAPQAQPRLGWGPPLPSTHRSQGPARLSFYYSESGPSCLPGVRRPLPNPHTVQLSAGSPNSQVHPQKSAGAGRNGRGVGRSRGAWGWLLPGRLNRIRSV